MDRRSLIKNAGMAGVLAAGVAPAIVHAQEVIRWRLASSFPKSLDTLWGGAPDFAQYVSEMTGGKFEITTHAPGELVPAFGVLDAAQSGTIEVAHTAPYYFFGKSPAFGLGSAIPFGLNARQRTAWMYQGNGAKLLGEFYAKYNVVAFPAGNTGAQMGGWYRKEIKSLKDFQGLKFRIGGFGGTVVAGIGGVPQNIPGGEIYQALEKGTIDACEWVGPYDDLKLGFNKVAPYYYYPGWWEGGPEIDVMINRDAYNKLPKEYQAIVSAASAKAMINMTAKYDARNPQALKTLLASGTKLRQMPKDIMDAAFNYAMKSYDELSDTNEDWKKIYTDYKAFRKDQNAWFRLTEGTFDRYMQQAKL